MTTKTKKSIGPITVEVSALDIKRAITGDAFNCAVARALKRLKRFADITVSSDAIEMTKGTGKNRVKLYFDTPKRVQKFIEKFDGSDKVKPFSFTLRKPTDIMSLAVGC